MGMPGWDRQDRMEGKPHGWVQWKGTNVCMDVHCECGFHGHIDDDFVYYVQCPRCGRGYMCNGHIQLVPLDEEEKVEASKFSTYKVLDDDEAQEKIPRGSVIILSGDSHAGSLSSLQAVRTMIEQLGERYIIDSELPPSFGPAHSIAYSATQVSLSRTMQFENGSVIRDMPAVDDKKKKPANAELRKYLERGTKGRKR